MILPVRNHKQADLEVQKLFESLNWQEAKNRWRIETLVNLKNQIKFGTRR